MATLNDSFTSTGLKIYAHQQAMENLRNGKGTPIVTHVLPTNLCNFTCAFCSVATREGGQVLSMASIRNYLEQLVPLGLKAVIVSGGGNPILYKDRETKENFDDLIAMISGYGLEIGLITNGVKTLKTFPDGRRSYPMVKPETLDRLLWLRVSLAGLDHEERESFFPDVNPTKTSLGMSWVMHDRFVEPLEPNHGKVSTEYDLRTPLAPGDGRAIWGDDELPWIEDKIAGYVETYKPRYVRLLPNCLEPDKIPKRAAQLREMALRINPDVCFVQEKPPRQPHACFKGVLHPVLDASGDVFPCDSVVLNKAANHKFASPWRICHMSEIGAWYAKKISPNVPNDICPGCVFADQVDALAEIVENKIATPMPEGNIEHVNFI